MLLDVPENTAARQVRDFANHFVESAVLSPLKGGYQLAQKSTGKLLPELEIKKSESKSTAAFLGDLAGTGVVFAGSWLLTRSALNASGINPNLPKTLLGKSGVSGLEMATTGTIVGLLHPVDSTKDFWSGKAEQTAYLAITSGLYGAGWKAMSSSGAFGKEGERTLKQAVLMNSTAGGAAGISDSLLRHGIIDKRLPTLGELGKSATQFALIGAGFGIAEIAAPRLLSGPISETTNQQIAREKGSRLSLSMSTHADTPSTARLTESLATRSIEPKTSLSQITDPLPNFSKITTPKVTPDKIVSSQALDQSFRYSRQGIVEEKLFDGARLATTNDSKGLSLTGAPVDRFERFIVLDKTSDPALAMVLDDARKRFAGLELNGETSMQLRNYVSNLFNRNGVSPATLEEIYVDTLRRNTTGLVPIGAFLCRGSGVCLPRAALLKSIGDDLGLSVRMREGFIGINKPQSHVWTEIDFGKGFKVFDPMHPPNPLFKYTSNKH